MPSPPRPPPSSQDPERDGQGYVGREVVDFEKKANAAATKTKDELGNELIELIKQWASDALIESYGIHDCYDLLEYYFDVSPSPSWKYFANYADKIIDAREQYKRDLIERKQRREKAREWLSE